MAKPETLIELSTTLGKDELRFRRMTATEELGRLFEFNVQALAKRAEIKMADLLGTPACVTLQLPDDSGRHFHGIICAAQLTDELEEGVEYRLVLRPWLWLLSRRSDNRIFQSMNAEEIAKEVFEPFGVDYVFELSAPLPSYEYFVQYRETDFNFVSRLFEQEGLYYFFRHTEDKHILVITDSSSSHYDCPVEDEFYWRPSADRGLNEEFITTWHSKREIQSGKWTLTDFNFKTPKTSLLATTSTMIEGASSKLEIYDYPGLYQDKNAGSRYIKLQMEQTDSQHALVNGSGSLRTLACGYFFRMKDHPDLDENTKYLAVATEIDMGSSGYESGAGQDFFRCNFLAMPADIQYRPERITRRPTVGGPHTATVVGPSGEEVHVDEFGRVKVHFHWDRLGKKDEKSSCYVRVSQGGAGNGWGMMWLPRIGQEVIVDFLEGNPDRPMITGRVYNADQLPPYPLPEHKTVSTLKSRSSQSGGATNFNELRFEDKKGNEYLFIQAEKDKLEIVKETSFAQIGKDLNQIVEGERKEKVLGGYDLIVDKNVRQTINGSTNIAVSGDFILKTDAEYDLKAAANIVTDAGSSYSLKTGTQANLKIGTDLGLDAGVNVHIKGGVNVVIEASAMLTLKVGGSSVVVGPDGVSVTGPMVKINSGGSPGSGGGASPLSPKSPETPADPEPPVDPLNHR